MSFFFFFHHHLNLIFFLPELLILSSIYHFLMDVILWMVITNHYSYLNRCRIFEFIKNYIYTVSYRSLKIHIYKHICVYISIFENNLLLCPSKKAKAVSYFIILKDLGSITFIFILILSPIMLWFLGLQYFRSILSLLTEL